MRLHNLVLIFVALMTAAPTLAADMSYTVVTSGPWTASKAGSRIAVPSNTPGVPVMAGAWTPSKPGARPVVATAARVPVTAGPSVSSKPWGRPAGSR